MSNHYPQVICSVLGGHGALTQVLLRRKEKLGPTTVVCRHVEFFLETRALTGEGQCSRHARVTRKVLHGAEKALACQSTPVLQPKSKPGFVVWGSFHWFSAESRHGRASSHHSPSCEIPRPLSFLHLSAHSSPISLSVFSASSLPPHPFRTRPLPSFLAVYSGSRKTQFHPCLSFSLPFIF